LAFTKTKALKPLTSSSIRVVAPGLNDYSWLSLWKFMITEGTIAPQSHQWQEISIDCKAFW